jgi:Tfp pilus assembly protein PilZ
MNQEIHTRVNRLTPIRIIELLEGIGMAVNENDTIGDLREAVRQSVAVGDISVDELPEVEYP